MAHLWFRDEKGGSDFGSVIPSWIYGVLLHVVHVCVGSVGQRRAENNTMLERFKDIFWVSEPMPASITHPPGGEKNLMMARSEKAKRSNTQQQQMMAVILGDPGRNLWPNSSQSKKISVAAFGTLE